MTSTDAMQAPSTTVIEPRSRFRLLDLREIWAYRELMWMLALRDIKVRYKHTVLGAAWAVLRPTLSMIMFSLVFGRLAKMPSNGVPYPIFVFAGLLPWMFFSQAVSGASGSVVGASSLITRVYFPRLVVPIASIAIALVDFLVALTLLLPLQLWYGVAPAASLLFAPVFVALGLLIALGFGILFSAVSVTYRDFRHIEPFLLQVWMFATPVVYPLNLIPDSWRPLVLANPMTGVIEGFRACWTGAPIDWEAAAMSAMFGVLMLLLGLVYFSRVERRFADTI